MQSVFAGRSILPKEGDQKPLASGSSIFWKVEDGDAYTTMEVVTLLTTVQRMIVSVFRKGN